MKPEAMLKLYRAMRLEIYPEPPVLDQKKELAASTEKSRFGQPVAQGFRSYGLGDEIEFVRFTPTSHKTERFYRTELDALMAARNRFAEDAATRLAKLDRRITRLLSAPIITVSTPGISDSYAAEFAKLAAKISTEVPAETTGLTEPEGKSDFSKRMKEAREAKKQKGTD